MFPGCVFAGWSVRGMTPPNRSAVCSPSAMMAFVAPLARIVLIVAFIAVAHTGQFAGVASGLGSLYISYMMPSSPLRRGARYFHTALVLAPGRPILSVASCWSPSSPLCVSSWMETMTFSPIARAAFTPATYSATKLGSKRSLPCAAPGSASCMRTCVGAPRPYVFELGKTVIGAMRTVVLVSGVERRLPRIQPYRGRRDEGDELQPVRYPGNPVS